jgi:hypothetical protein
MRQIDEKTGWEASRADVLFTESVLGASEAHPKLLRAMRVQNERWTALDVERREAEDRVVRANARVSWLDLRLDGCVRVFANELLRDAGGNKDDKTFRAYFPEAPSEVIRLGLESEIERCERFDTVRERVTISKPAAAKLAAVDAAISEGKAALQGRRDAFAARTGVSLDVESWKEATNAARESVYLQLRTWALENGEERGYADRFFPLGNARSPRAAVEDGEQGGSKDIKDESNKPTG